MRIENTWLYFSASYPDGHPLGGAITFHWSWEPDYSSGLNVEDILHKDQHPAGLTLRAVRRLIEERQQKKRTNVAENLQRNNNNYQQQMLVAMKKEEDQEEDGQQSIPPKDAQDNNNRKRGKEWGSDRILAIELFLSKFLYGFQNNFSNFFGWNFLESFGLVKTEFITAPDPPRRNDKTKRWTGSPIKIFKNFFKILEKFPNEKDPY